MMRIIVLIAILATVSAFSVRNSATRRSAVLRMSEDAGGPAVLEMEPAVEEAEAAAPAPVAPTVSVSDTLVTAGATAPLAGKSGAWDPLGLSNQYGEGELNIKFRKTLQEAERKHGRVAMLAFVGILFGETFAPLFDGSVTGPAINQWQQVVAIYPPFQILTVWVIGMAEANVIMKYWDEPGTTFSNPTGLAGLKDDFTPGDYGFDPLNIRPKTPDALNTMISKELNNGRLAMIAVAGIVAQELVSGNSVF